MEKFGDVAQAIVDSVDKTREEMVLAMTKAMFPDNHSEVLFAKWMVANSGRVPEACGELGVELPSEGPGLYQRLKAAVMPALVESELSARSRG